MSSEGASGGCTRIRSALQSDGLSRSSTSDAPHVPSASGPVLRMPCWVCGLCRVPDRHLGDARSSLGHARSGAPLERGQLALGAAELAVDHGVLARAGRAPSRRSGRPVTAASGERVKSSSDHAPASEGPTVSPWSAPRGPADLGGAGLFYQGRCGTGRQGRIAAAAGRCQNPHPAGARGSGK